MDGNERMADILTENHFDPEQKCAKCGHVWMPRPYFHKPAQCPRCKTYKWEGK